MDNVTRKIAEYWTRHPEHQQEKKKAFVEALRENGNVRHAAAVAHVDRRTAYAWRMEDPQFRAAWDTAKEDVVDQAEHTLYEMATSGKNVVATIFYLKANRIQYRDRLSIDVLSLQREVEDRLAQMGDCLKSPREVIAEVIGTDLGELKQ